MYLDNDSRRPSLTPQLALRVAIIGGIALVAVRGRLLPALVPAGALGRQVRDRGQRQPGAQDQGAGAARRDRGPRGPGAGGQPHRPGRARDARRAARGRRRAARGLQPARPRARAATRSGSSARWSDQLKALPFSPATVKQDVPQKLVFYLFENQEDFPGVTVEQVFLREYPHRQVGAHLFGTVGEITKEQQDDTALPRRGAGRPRRPVGHRVPVRPLPARAQRRQPRCRSTRWATCAASCATVRPEQGRQLRLSVDLDVQRVGQQRARRRQGRVRGHEREQRRGAGARQLALVRPQRVRQGDPQARPRAPQLQGERRAAAQPRHPGRLSHRLDLQADHRHRGAARAA